MLMKLSLMFSSFFYDDFRPASVYFPLQFPPGTDLGSSPTILTICGGKTIQEHCLRPAIPYTTFSLQHIDDSQSPLSAGRLNTDGTVHVIMCDFIQSWEALSDTQMRSLTLRYQSGCDCKVCVMGIIVI